MACVEPTQCGTVPCCGGSSTCQSLLVRLSSTVSTASDLLLIKQCKSAFILLTLCHMLHFISLRLVLDLPVSNVDQSVLSRMALTAEKVP